MNRKAFRTIAAVVTAGGAALGLSATAQASGVSGPAIYVDHVLYRTVATPTDLSETGAPEQSWDTIYNFFGAQRSVATAAPGDPGFTGGRWQVHKVSTPQRLRRGPVCRRPRRQRRPRRGRRDRRGPGLRGPGRRRHRQVLRLHAQQGAGGRLTRAASSRPRAPARRPARPRFEAMSHAKRSGHPSNGGARARVHHRARAPGAPAGAALLRPGPEVRRRQRSWRALDGRHGGAGRLPGPRHVDCEPPRTEDMNGAWLSAAACMRSYLILRVRSRAFRSDPRERAGPRGTPASERAGAAGPWPRERRSPTCAAEERRRRRPGCQTRWLLPCRR